MQLTINAENKVFDRQMTVSQLLEHLQLDTRKIAVECNEEIIAKSTYSKRILSDGDKLEIIAFIGGG